MRQYNITELAQIWLRNGGARAHVVVAVAVAKAESNGFERIVSPAADYGLWQINISNFTAHGLTVEKSFNPDTNAQVAIDMSGNGTNWAAWCTCWQNPARDCGHGFLPVPQPNTPAGDHIAGVAAVLGEYPPELNGPAPSTSNTSGFLNAWNTVSSFHGPYARRRWQTIRDVRGAIGRVRP